MQHDDDVIELEFSDHAAPCHVHSRAQVMSPHTGHILQVLKGDIVASGATAEKFLEFIAQPKGQEMRGTRRADGKRGIWTFRVMGRSISNNVLTAAVELKEKEALQATALEIDGRQFSVSSFKEEFRDEGIYITVILDLALDQLDEVHHLVEGGGYHEVVRRGISVDPVRMRLGGIAPWSKDAESAKYGIVLFEESGEMKGEKSDPLLHLHSSVADNLAFRIGLMEGLFDLLTKRGMISAAEVEKLHADSRGRIPERRRAFWEVTDVAAIDF